ncbi:DUF2721 domain-containing protein [Sphingobium boeckii]|uniref:DUF2721 domain-containing protein n=1 Tax=Sphingobium boeckii TaxID=1082345 RepID=A0A7W9ECQ4_9SPHN|nr:DUF2721 domain-containing protein [Sphingobium boeckii]MBB5684528.1 hypothetical protein [Sphingobium boeckii]
MTEAAAVTTIAQTIQFAVAPVFLLTGIGALLNVMASRLARVVDRARTLELLHPESTDSARERYEWELRLLNRRMTIVNASIFMIVASAVAVCSVVGLLFVAELGHFHIGNAVAIVFIIAMGLLVMALFLFLIEIRLGLHAIRTSRDLLGKRK